MYFHISLKQKSLSINGYGVNALEVCCEVSIVIHIVIELGEKKHYEPKSLIVYDLHIDL